MHENGVESGNLLNTKMIYNFDTFLKSTNTPSYAQRFMSYDHCKLGRGIRSGQIGTLKPFATEFWKNPEHQIPREFYNLSNEG
jgi:hypothetical protein